MYDTDDLSSQYCCETAPEQQWVEQFQTQTLSLLQALPGQAIGLFSSSCLVHCLSANADWYQFTVDGESLASAVGKWYFEMEPVRQVSSCTGWDCTLQCSGGPWMPTNQQCMTTTNQCANNYMTPPDAQKPPPLLPPGMTAQQAGDIAWAQAQAKAVKSIALPPGMTPQQAGNIAWAKAQAQAAQGVNPYALAPGAKAVPPSQAAAAGKQAWAQQQAAANRAAAEQAGNEAWSVAQAQALAQGIQPQPQQNGGWEPQPEQQNSDWDATSATVKDTEPALNGAQAWQLQQLQASQQQQQPGHARRMLRSA